MIKGKNGCRVHDDCLQCPLPKCIEEVSQAEARRIIRKQKDRNLARQVSRMMEQGMTLRQAVMSVTEQRGMKDPSNIYRALKRHQQGEQARRRE